MALRHLLQPAFYKELEEKSQFTEVEDKDGQISGESIPKQADQQDEAQNDSEIQLTLYAQINDQSTSTEFNNKNIMRKRSIGSILTQREKI